MPLSDIDPTDFSDPIPGKRSSEHWMVLVIAVLGALALVLVGLFLTPDERGFGTHERLGLQPCYAMEVWNFPCPGCGVTTSLAHATHGDLLGSLVTQPFGLFLAVLALVFIVWAVLGHLRGRDLWIDLNSRDWFRWIVLTASFMALSWAYKIARVREIF